VRSSQDHTRPARSASTVHTSALRCARARVTQSPSTSGIRSASRRRCIGTACTCRRRWTAGPHQEIAPDATWRPTFAIRQQAAGGDTLVPLAHDGPQPRPVDTRPGEHVHPRRRQPGAGGTARASSGRRSWSTRPGWPLHCNASAALQGSRVVAAMEAMRRAACCSPFSPRATAALSR
jgi:hypothetical protein